MSPAATAALLFLMAAAASALFLPPLAPLLRALGLERRNFAGEPILAAAGLAPALATAAVSLAAAHAGDTRLPVPFAWRGQEFDLLGEALASAALAFAGLGLIDDLWGSRDIGGLRGHLRCLMRERRLTTGLIKAVGGAAAGCALGAVIARQAPESLAAGSAPGTWDLAGRVVLTGAWIALAANAANLLDLRPLRALKGAALLAALIAALSAALLSASRPAALIGLAPLAGALAPYLRWEALRRAMLGDAGANFLGAAVATVGAFVLPPAALVLLVGLLLGFHLWTEGHSLSAAIAARPWLCRLDAWGWQPPVRRDEEMR
jgi:UDP-GlcNAc:undecaprenyl-phosphate/decaprenyl-phosphate GlcNAc-1-phosphate transferase